MQLEPGNLSWPADRALGGTLTAAPSPVRLRMLTCAAALAALAAVAAAVLGWGPLQNRILGLSAPTVASTHTGIPVAVARLPLSAQGQLSGILATDRRGFQSNKVAGGFALVNPAEALRARFSPRGVALAVDGGANLSVNLSLKGLSQGGVRTPIGPVAPTAAANRVSYSHGVVREWYRNGPLGIEQGFEIARAPRGHGSGPLMLDMALDASVPARLSEDGERLTFTRGSTTLNYRGLVVTGAQGARVSSHLALHGGTLSIVVDARQARYPLTIDPLIQKGGKLTGGEAEDESLFGTSAALSATAARCWSARRRPTRSRGAAWVFVRSGGSAGSQQGANADGPGARRRAPGARRMRRRIDRRSRRMRVRQQRGAVGRRQHGADRRSFADGDGGNGMGVHPLGIAMDARPTARGGDGKANEGRFGNSVALSADGSTALVGDPVGDGRNAAALGLHALGIGRGRAQPRCSTPKRARWRTSGAAWRSSADGADGADRRAGRLGLRRRGVDVHALGLGVDRRAAS